jgi:bifunctional non-homologous end joining protein LigD
MVEPQGSVTRVEVGGRTLKLTSLEKLLYPSTEMTKGEVLNYYATVAPILLPHMASRPVTRVRWPHGVIGDSFFEKNVRPGCRVGSSG